MIGTCLSNKGGITTVLNLYQQAGFMEQSLYLASSKDGASLDKVLMYLQFLTQLVVSLISHPEIQIAHMHVSQRGSFLRKSLAFLICKAFCKKVIWHMHGSEFISFYTSANGLYKAYINKIVTSLDCLIALSEKRKSELLGIIPNAKVMVVYNPCLLQGKEILASRKRLSQQDKTNESSFVNFLFMGRYGKRKGVYDLIEAVKLLNNSNIRVALYGDVEVEPVQAKVIEAGLSEQIQVNTWISGEEKHRVFSKSDVLLLPSYNEGLPMAILEAMGYAMPVISTPVGGIPEAIIDGENGYLVEPGNVKELAEKMRCFLEYPDLIQKMGQTGYQMAAETFELSKVIAQLSILYEEVQRTDYSYIPAQQSEKV